MPKLRDVVIHAYSKTNLYLRESGYAGHSIFSEWSTLVSNPILIELPTPPAPEGRIRGTGDFFAEAAKLSQSTGDFFIKAMIKRYAVAQLGPDERIGRVACFGFSAGCGMLEYIAQNESHLVDFMCATDGLYQGPKYLKLAQKAYSGQNAQLVCLYTEIDQASQSSTTYHARWLRDKLLAGEAADEASAGLSYQSKKLPEAWHEPASLLNTDGSAPPPNASDAKGSYYTLQKGLKYYADEWPIRESFTGGNLVLAGFKGTQADAHIWAADWAQPEAIRSCLIPRWTIECEKPVSELEDVSAPSGRAFVQVPAQLVSTPKVSVYPTAKIKRDPAQSIVVTKGGLGEDAEALSCRAYGNFVSGILSDAEIAAIKQQSMQQKLLVAGGLGLIALGVYYWSRDA